MTRTLTSIGILLAVVVCGLLVTQSLGQPGGTAATKAASPIAVVDLVRIFNECAQIKDLNEVIRQKRDDITREGNQRKEVIEGKQTALSAFQPGKADYETRRRELLRLNTDANVWFKLMEDEVDRDMFHWTRVIYEQTMEIAGQVARESGYAVVLHRSEFKPFEIEQSVQTLRRFIQDRSVVYNIPDVDITDIVVRRMDAAYAAGGGRKQLLPVEEPTTKP